MESREGLMADWGFTVKDYTDTLHIKLVISAFLKVCDQSEDVFILSQQSFWKNSFRTHDSETQNIPYIWSSYSTEYVRFLEPTTKTVYTVQPRGLKILCSFKTAIIIAIHLRKYYGSVWVCVKYNEMGQGYEGK